MHAFFHRLSQPNSFFIREDYVKWRTDAAALECNHCKTIFTRHHIGKANLILDLRKSMETDDSSTIKSTIGKMHLKIKKHVRSVHDIQALPFNSGLDAIKDYLVNNQKEAGLEDDGCIDGTKLHQKHHSIT